MIDLEALKGQLHLLGHDLPEEQIRMILADMHIDFSEDDEPAPHAPRLDAPASFSDPPYPHPADERRQYIPHDGGQYDDDDDEEQYGAGGPLHTILEVDEQPTPSPAPSLLQHSTRSSAPHYSAEDPVRPYSHYSPAAPSALTFPGEGNQRQDGLHASAGQTRTNSAESVRKNILTTFDQPSSRSQERDGASTADLHSEHHHQDTRHGGRQQEQHSRAGARSPTDRHDKDGRAVRAGADAFVGDRHSRSFFEHSDDLLPDARQRHEAEHSAGRRPTSAAAAVQKSHRGHIDADPYGRPRDSFDPYPAAPSMSGVRRGNVAADDTYRRPASSGGGGIAGTAARGNTAAARPPKFEESLRSSSPTGSSVLNFGSIDGSSRRHGGGSSSSSSVRPRGSSAGGYGTGGARKVDRVARYQQMAQTWGKDRFLQSGASGEKTATRKPLNFCHHFAILHDAEARARAMMLKDTRSRTAAELRPGMSFQPGPTKRRDALRWDVRVRMNQPPLPHNAAYLADDY